MLTNKMKRVIRSVTKQHTDRLEDTFATREFIAGHVYALGQAGKVAIVTGGMDCDCATWEGDVTLVPAIPMAVVKFVQDMYLYADGPRHWEMMRPSLAAEVHQTSRDLALEAFEDGHPGTVHY